VAKRDYLSFERTPRSVEVQEDPPEQIERLEHPAFIARFGRSDQVDGICDRDRWSVGQEKWLPHGKASVPIPKRSADPAIDITTGPMEEV